MSLASWKIKFFSILEFLLQSRRYHAFLNNLSSLMSAKVEFEVEK